MLKDLMGRNIIRNKAVTMDSIEQKRLGLRIKSIRILTGLNQEEFAKACDFNYASLRNWEFGRVAIRKEALDRLILAFRSFSIFVDRDWLYFGQGEGPVFTSTKSDLTTDSTWKNETNEFRKTCADLGENPLVLEIEDDEMAPIYNKGDLLGAVTKSLRGLFCHQNGNEFFSKPMLVKLDDKKFHLRRICYVDEDLWLATGDKGNRASRIIGDIIGVVLMHISASFYSHSMKTVRGHKSLLLNNKMSAH